MAKKPQYPVYLFTGFLEGGKTKMIQEILEDENFNDGCKILLIVCEEGVEEYEPHRFWGKNVRQMTVNHPEELTAEILTDYVRNHVVDRVMIEYNGMWQLEDLYEALPPDFYVFQQILVADGSTILNYNANMRSLVFDKLQNAETVIFNRAEGVDREAIHKLVRGVSRRATIAYETAEGELEYDEIEDPLPFDVNAPVVQIADNDYAIFYRDLAEEMPEWQGKTVKFKGMVARDKHLGKTALVIGRHVMTCCADDITFSGLVCNFDRDVSFKTGEWIMVTARIRIQSHALYGSEGPVLYATDVAATSEPKQPVATFY
jgi:G3E family GTPase